MLEMGKSIKVNGKIKNKNCFRRNKMRDGLGVQLWPDGSRYDGMW